MKPALDRERQHRDSVVIARRQAARGSGGPRAPGPGGPRRPRRGAGVSPLSLRVIRSSAGEPAPAGSSRAGPSPRPRGSAVKPVLLGIERFSKTSSSRGTCSRCPEIAAEWNTVSPAVVCSRRAPPVSSAGGHLVEVPVERGDVEHGLPADVAPGQVLGGQVLGGDAVDRAVLRGLVQEGVPEVVAVQEDRRGSAARPGSARGCRVPPPCGRRCSRRCCGSRGSRP